MSDRFRGTALNTPIVVVIRAVSADVNSRARAWIYIIEILRCAGLSFDHMSTEDLPSLPGHVQLIVLLAGDLRLTSEQRHVLEDSVRGGGSLAGIGRTSGVDEIFGVGAQRPLAESWLKVTARNHPDGVPAFIEPVSDELREIILRAVFCLARQQGISLPVLWYWPRGLEALGHVSHDTDQNDPHNAVVLLEMMNRCRVKSTWCILYPGGYPGDSTASCRSKASGSVCITPP